MIYYIPSYPKKGLKILNQTGNCIKGKKLQKGVKKEIISLFLESKYFLLGLFKGNKCFKYYKIYSFLSVYCWLSLGNDIFSNLKDKKDKNLSHKGFKWIYHNMNKELKTFCHNDNKQNMLFLMKI